MTTPTREEVFSAYDDLNNSIKTGYLLEKLDILKDTYLAQEEELRGLERGFCEKIEKIGDLVVNAQLLQAENEALKAELLRLETHQ